MKSELTMKVIETSLMGLGRRIDATSRNIANMNTPQYSRAEVSFESQLHDVIDGPGKLPMSTTDPTHISNVTRSVEEVKRIERRVGYEVYRGDSNNVDPELETARLTETRMLYEVLARRMSGKFSGLKRVISTVTNN